MKKTSAIFAIALAIIACSKEPVIAETASDSLTISAGYEGNAEPDTRTYIKDASAGTIWWGTSGVDKVLFVFDESGTKNVLTSQSAVSEAVRSFSSDSWSGGNWKYAVWTGCSAAKDQCSLSGTVISGPTLKVTNPQEINNSSSFCNTANIAVMKPADNVMRNVFGYLRFMLPSYPETSYSAIKSITLTADEYVAGDIQIDYSAEVPVATVISNDNASRSLTLNTRFKNGYEGGIVWMILPAGTYHNARLTITPFTSTPSTQEASTGEPFTVNIIGNLKVTRSQYTDCGTLPAEDPRSSEPDVEDPQPDEWPDDPDAFDYGLDAEQSRRSAYISEEFAKYDIDGADKNKRNIVGPVTVDGVTYGGPGLSFYGNRVTANKVKDQWSTEFPNIIPTQCYHSFKINRPGSVTFFQSISSGITRIPTYYLAVVTDVNGVTTAKVVDSFTPDASGVIDGSQSSGRPGNPYQGDTYKDYYVTLTVSEDDIAGITSAATVYLYHMDTVNNTNLVHYYPLIWTSQAGGSAEVQRKAKILLAGDSLVTEYSESAAPQTGWGQCLSAALGDDVQVRNHAIGGESTKSFIDSGKWEGLLEGVLSGDVVLIQFMHNDQKTDDAHKTDPATTYKDNLRKFISETRARGGVPVLVTSILRRQFSSNGLPQRSLGDFPDAMRSVAAETSTPLIDGEQWSYEWLSELGEEGSVPYYVMDKRDPSKMDNTHLTRDGAETVARMIAQGLRDKGVWK